MIDQDIELERARMWIDIHGELANQKRRLRVLIRDIHLEKTEEEKEKIFKETWAVACVNV